MATPTIGWDASWSSDTTIGSTINDGASDRSAEYSNNGGLMHEFSIKGTYSAGTYDGPALCYVLRKIEGTTTYQDQANAYTTLALNGGSGLAFNAALTVGPDINEFLLEIVNDSNLNISGLSLDYKATA